MNIASIWAEIEANQTWRQDEIRFFQNQLANLNTIAEQDQFRRAIILLLYAHFEGFCKFALTLYVNSINNENIKCGEANYSISAVSLADVFTALRHNNSKSDVFKNALPEDAKLHLFARDREFVEKIADIDQLPVSIPDHVVDTESNLKPIVLRKNLYRLGLRYDQLSNIEGKIELLLNYRNKIAHGQSQTGIELQKYEELRKAAYKIMDEVKRMVMNALQNRDYLRN